jgi:hypothetical protein
MASWRARVSDPLTVVQWKEAEPTGVSYSKSVIPERQNGPQPPKGREAEDGEEKSVVAEEKAHLYTALPELPRRWGFEGYWETQSEGVNRG